MCSSWIISANCTDFACALLFPTTLCCCAVLSLSVMWPHDSLWPHGLYLPGSFGGDSPGKNPGVGCHAFSSPGLLHCRQILYHLSHQRGPRILEWVAYPFSRGTFWPRNRTGVSCSAGGLFTRWAIRKALLHYDSHFCTASSELSLVSWYCWSQNELGSVSSTYIFFKRLFRIDVIHFLNVWENLHWYSLGKDISLLEDFKTLDSTCLIGISPFSVSVSLGWNREVRVFFRNWSISSN